MVNRVGKLAAFFLLPGLIFVSLSARSSERAQEEAPETLPFIEVPGLSAPVIRDGRLSYFLFLRLKLVVEKPESLGLVESQLPRLRDSFLLVLHRGPLLGPDGRQVDLNDLVGRLRDMANQTLGEVLVHEVVVLDARKG